MANTEQKAIMAQQEIFQNNLYSEPNKESNHDIEQATLIVFHE